MKMLLGVLCLGIVLVGVLHDTLTSALGFSASFVTAALAVLALLCLLRFLIPPREVWRYEKRMVRRPSA